MQPSQTQSPQGHYSPGPDSTVPVQARAQESPVVGSARVGLVLGISALILKLAEASLKPSWLGSVTWGDLASGMLAFVAWLLVFLVALVGGAVSLVALNASFSPGRRQGIPYAALALLLNIAAYIWTWLT